MSSVRYEMAPKKQDLYVFLDSEHYKTSKANVLGSQSDLLKIMKSLQNLKVLARQKSNLKIQLKKLINETKKEISFIDEKLPEPRLPKSLTTEEKIETKESKKKDFSKRKAIDSELREINEKLKKLNG